MRSFAFSRSVGRPFSARIWLCRQRIASRTSSRFSAAGSSVVFWHVIDGGLGLRLLGRDLRALTGALVAERDRRLDGLGLLLAGVGGRSGDEHAGGDGGDGQDSSEDGLGGHGRDLHVAGVGSVGGSGRPDVPCQHESFGSPAGSESPVALRPALADGLPFREARTLLLPSSAGARETFTFGWTYVRGPLRYCPQTGRGAAWLARVLWEHEVAGSNPAAPIDR